MNTEKGRSRIQQLLNGSTSNIDYAELISKHSWISSKKMNCVISPDSDGLLCGLFMSQYLGWNIVGFYDGKILLLEDGFSQKDIVFLDMEIFRKDTRSMGHHMMLFNYNQKPDNWEINMKNCIQPNNMRNYDACHKFRLKYPLANIHLLIGIIGSKIKLDIPKSAICPLFFTDGTFNVLFRYPENVLNWLKYLRAHEEESPLKLVFENDHYSVFSLMQAMDDFFRRRDIISISGERGDRLKISNNNGTPFNVIKSNGTFKLKTSAKERVLEFINILSELTKWKYNTENWIWDGFKLYQFTKSDFGRDKRRINGQTFRDFILRNPLSWAITAQQRLEYTLEEPDRLP